MTKTYIVVALRLVLALTMPDAAQAWPGQSSAPPQSIACLENDRRTECNAAVLVRVAVVDKATHARLYAHGAERPTNLQPRTVRSPARDEDPLASMHFE